MANIVNVNYEAMPALARQVRKYAQDLNTELVNAYTSIADMHNSWYGKRYNSLVKEFNNIIPEVNELLELVVGDIPYVLETIANNYAQADKRVNVTSAMKTAPKKVTSLAMPNDVGMKFQTNQVSATKSKVSTNFKNSKEKMNSIEATCNKLEWKSEAADAFKTKFAKLKKNIVAAFENIDTQFSKLMAQTMEDIQSTESANTVG